MALGTMLVPMNAGSCGCSGSIEYLSRRAITAGEGFGGYDNDPFGQDVQLTSQTNFGKILVAAPIILRAGNAFLPQGQIKSAPGIHVFQDCA